MIQISTGTLTLMGLLLAACSALDIAANVNLATVNGTYYNGDNVHLTDAGYALVAATVAAALQELFG